MRAFGHLDIEDQAAIACMDKTSPSSRRACQEQFRAFMAKEMQAMHAARLRRFEQVYASSRGKTVGEQIEAAAKGDNLAVVVRSYIEYAAGRLAFERWELALRGAVARGDLFQLKDQFNPDHTFYSGSYTVLTDEEVLEAMGVRGWEAMTPDQRRRIIKNSYAMAPEAQSTGQDPWDNFFGDVAAGVSSFVAGAVESGALSGDLKKLGGKGLDAKKARELIARLPIAKLTLEQATPEGLRMVVDAMDGHTGLAARRVRASRRHNEYSVYQQMRNHIRRAVVAACPGEGGGVDGACALRFAADNLGGALDDRLDERRGEFDGAVSANPYNAARGPFDASDPEWMEVQVQGEQIPTTVGIVHPGQEPPAPSLADRIKAIFGLGITQAPRGPLDLSGEPGVSSQPMTLMRASAPKMKISKDDRAALAALDAATRATVKEQKGWLERQYDDLKQWVGSGDAQDAAASTDAKRQRSDVETALMASELGTGAGVAGTPNTASAPAGGGKPRSAPAAPAGPDLAGLKAKWEDARSACNKAQAGGLAASFLPFVGPIYNLVSNDQLDVACKEAEALRTQYIAALRQADPNATLPQETSLIDRVFGGGDDKPQEKSWIALAMEQFFDNLALQAVVGGIVVVLVAAGGGYLLMQALNTTGQTVAAVAPHAGDILRGAAEVVPAAAAVKQGGSLLSALGGMR